MGNKQNLCSSCTSHHHLGCHQVLLHQNQSSSVHSSVSGIVCYCYSWSAGMNHMEIQTQVGHLWFGNHQKNLQKKVFHLQKKQHQRHLGSCPPYRCCIEDDLLELLFHQHQHWRNPHHQLIIFYFWYVLIITWNSVWLSPKDNPLITPLFCMNKTWVVGLFLFFKEGNGGFNTFL